MGSMSYRRVILLTALVWGCWLPEADATIRRFGPKQLTLKADAIVVLRATGYSFEDQAAQAEVVSSARGELNQGISVEFIYPDRGPEETWTESGPLERGTCLLAFLERSDSDEAWVPVCTGKRRVPAFLIAGALTEATRYIGRQGVRKVDCGEAGQISVALREFLRWDEMERDDRRSLLDACFASDSSSLKKLALEWVLMDRQLSFVDPEDVEGFFTQMAGWSVTCATDSQRDIRFLALTGLNLAARKRKDVLPYFADALDDPDWLLRSVAVRSLERHTPEVAAGPVVDTSASLDVKVAAWKDWWREKGSQIPEFERFVPAGRAESPPPPECPQNESERRK
jgi:hypothetical protein